MTKSVIKSISLIIIFYGLSSYLTIIFTHIQSVNVHIANALIMIEQWAFQFGLILLIIGTYRRKITVQDILIALVIAYFINENELIFGFFHEVLFGLNLYPSFVVKNNSVNVQYAALIPYFIFLIILFVITSIKKYRSIGRTFILILSVIFLTTTSLFHSIIVQGSLMQNIEEVRNERAELASYLLQKYDIEDELEWNGECLDYNFKCASGNFENLRYRDDLLLFSGSMNYGLSEIRRLSKVNNGKLNPIHRYSDTVSVLSEPVIGNQIVAQYFTDSDYIRVMSDQYSFLPAVWQHKIYFSILVISVHMWWTLGALFFLDFHHRKYKRTTR